MHLDTCQMTCSGHGDFYQGQCICAKGWKGQECDVPSTECLDPECSGNGNCLEGICACIHGWTGENCQKSKITCNLLPPSIICQLVYHKLWKKLCLSLLPVCVLQGGEMLG